MKVVKVFRPEIVRRRKLWLTELRKYGGSTHSPGANLNRGVLMLGMNKRRKLLAEGHGPITSMPHAILHLPAVTKKVLHLKWREQQLDASRIRLGIGDRNLWKHLIHYDTQTHQQDEY